MTLSRPNLLCLAFVAVAFACAHPAARSSISTATQPGPALRLGADLHVHFGMKDALPFYAGEPGRGRMAEAHDELWANQISADGLERAGVRVLVAALWPAFDLRPGRDVMGEALAQLDGLSEFVRRNPRFAQAGSVEEARAALAAGKIALWPCLEGGEAIRSLEDVDVLFAAGARCVELVHFTDNDIADAEDDQFGATVGLVANGRDGGLSALGRSAVQRMIELGIVVDLSHASDRTMRDALELTEAAGVPVIYSHAGSAFGRPRTLGDTLARRIAEGGGLIGVGLYRSQFLDPIPEDERWPGFADHTCDEAIAHWRHYAATVGAESVLLGSDLSSVIMRGEPGGSCPEGIRNVEDLPTFFGALEKHGVPRESLDAGGERLLELLEKVEARASSEARRAAAQSEIPRQELFDVPL